MLTPDLTRTSPNFNHVRPRGDGVVIHATRSGVSMNPSEFVGTLNWFANPENKVSAHWVIARDGRAARVIPDDFSAWHAQEHNATHWAIELEQGVESDGFTDAQIAKCVLVCRGYVEDFGVPVAHAMNGFVGHEETPQGRRVKKSDPGAGFPWQAFMAALSGDDFTYTREEALFAISVLAFRYGAEKFNASEGLAKVHPHDVRVLKDIVGRLP